MKIRICDMCGVEIDDDAVTNERYIVKLKDIATRLGITRTKRYDLCNKCMQSIARKIREETDGTEGEE